MIAFFGAGAALLRFAFWGPFKLTLPVNSPVNAEGVLALSFLLLVLLRASIEEPGPGVVEAKHSRITPLICVAVVAIPMYLITANAPLLHDSYTHVAEAASEKWSQVLGTFFKPAGSDLFFRPFAYLTYWLDFKWAGNDPLRWHLWNLILHTANSCLVYLLARGLLRRDFAAMVAALIFALHGSRPEVVSWMAARFDLLASFFLLLSLVALDRYLGTKKWRYCALMVCCAILALLSKETAYCLPFLALGFIPFKDRTIRKSILRAASVQFATCAIMLLYRFWVLRSIGGYQSSEGVSAILNLNLIHVVKGLFFRQWAFLFFPINWSADVGASVKGSIVLMLTVMVGFLIWSKPRWQLLLAAIALVLAAALPVQHLLLITADLAGSRVLYLPVLGLALFWGLMAQVALSLTPEHR